MAEKLVRDRIPDLVRASGSEPVTRTLDDYEFAEALRAKLMEEAAELCAAPPSEVVEEIADVVEVLLAIADSHRTDWSAVEQVRRKKALERGAFEKRISMEYRAR